MSEILIFPEMIAAVVEELRECQDRGLRDEQAVVCIYLAMHGYIEMLKIRGDQEHVH